MNEWAKDFTIWNPTTWNEWARLYHLEHYHWEWIIQRLYHLEPYTGNELSKDFTIWNPTTENELSKDFTIWSTTTGNSQVLITHHGLDLERLLLHVPLLKELAGHKFCHLPQIEQCTSTDVLGCQAPNQLQPIRTPQIIFCVESLNSGAHVKPTS